MAKLTPMMAQYKEIKAQYADAILMYRLGDFYEMFFEDAVEASKILQITLTARNKKGDGPSVPMCGVPFHAVEGYMAKLTRAGKKVAICDQLTAPNGKGIVQRDVVRIVTPGTTFDESILEGKANNYVAVVLRASKKAGEDERFAFAYADVTTGEFQVTELASGKDLATEFQRIGAAECICADDDLAVLQARLDAGRDSCWFPYLYAGRAEEDLLKNFALKNLKSFDLEGRDLAVQAAATLLSYLKETQKTELQHIRKIRYYRPSEFVPLDGICIRNLELFANNQDGKKLGSLIGVLDQTVSAMGGRMIRNWLLHPLLDQIQIEERLNRVEKLVNNVRVLRELRDLLSKIYDVERLLSKLSLGTGNARDLLAMKESLKVIPLLKNEIAKDLPQLAANLQPLNDLVALIEKAISDEAPATVREGGMIRQGYHSELDKLLAISGEGKTFIKNLQEREAARTGVSSLKVKYNKVFGYYIEISKANLAAVPDDYIRKQTLVNAERYITPKLKEYEEKVLSAEDKIKELEYELFYEVRMEVVKEIVAIQADARILAALDVLGSFAQLAVRNRYCKPEILEEGMDLVGARHPVVEKMESCPDFVPNDCQFDDDRQFLLITGPNMGGKSTYLRMVALVQLLAQIGSYVPARKAHLSLVDRIFTRVGANDNLAAGESTFMVEMTEAAYILNNATEKSLIILDEIGRGTSTYDGVSIAWAMMEFLHNQIGAKVLFATHYHELIELADKLAKSCNMSVAVRENQEEGVVFLYKIVEGGVDKSYGIEVAKLAGLPMDLVSRARGVLDELETKQIKKGPVTPGQMGLFTEREQQKLENEERKILENLKDLDINKLSPLELMQKISDIKGKML
jgi:DNA mismatch repair protein MutS